MRVMEVSVSIEGPSNGGRRPESETDDDETVFDSGDDEYVGNTTPTPSSTMTLCHICAGELCTRDNNNNCCCKSPYTFDCCRQRSCLECSVTLAKRCGCCSDCHQIIIICPFCRNMSSVSAFDLFLSRKQQCQLV